MKSEIGRSLFFPFICILISIYFFYHGIEGNHGIHRMNKVKKEIQTAETIHKNLLKEKNLLQSKVNALSPKSLDMDQLEESAFRILNMGDESTLIIFN